MRALHPGITLTRADEDGKPVAPTLTGHFSVFNTWTEINSIFEGRFLERIAPGAFRKSFKSDRAQMRALFQHGYDPQVGDKPLGPIVDLREDDKGAYYEVELLDTEYVRELIPGLEAGLYGASFRFRVMREEWVDEPEPSPTNPNGLPERTIKEAHVMEFGPVTFGAYPEATAGIRSLTDEFVIERFASRPKRLREIVDARPTASHTLTVEVEGEERAEVEETAPSVGSAEVEPHPARERSEESATAEKPRAVKDYLTNQEDQPTWLLP